MHWGRQSGGPGDCWVQWGEGLLNKTFLILTCGFFYGIPGKCRTGEKLFAVPRAACSGVIPDLEPWGASGSLGDTTAGGGGQQISAH